MNDIKIHDIKDIVEVPDLSLYIYYGLIVLGFCLIVFAIYLLYKFIKNIQNNDRKKYIEILENLNFDNSKHTAYQITKYGLLLAQNEREKQLYHDLILQLEIYKYKKDVPSFEKETKLLFDIFMESLDA